MSGFGRDDDLSNGPPVLVALHPDGGIGSPHGSRAPRRGLVDNPGWLKSATSRRIIPACASDSGDAIPRTRNQAEPNQVPGEASDSTSDNPVPGNARQDDGRSRLTVAD